MPAAGVAENEQKHTETHGREEGKHPVAASPAPSMTESLAGGHFDETGTDAQLGAGRQTTKRVASAAPDESEHSANRNGTEGTGADAQKFEAHGDTMPVSQRVRGNGPAPTRMPIALVNKGREGGCDMSPPGTSPSPSVISVGFCLFFSLALFLCVIAAQLRCAVIPRRESWKCSTVLRLVMTSQKKTRCVLSGCLFFLLFRTSVVCSKHTLLPIANRSSLVHTHKLSPSLSFFPSVCVCA